MKGSFWDSLVAILLPLIIEYFFIQVLKDRLMGNSGSGKSFSLKSSMYFFIGGILGAIIIPITLTAYLPLKKITLNAFNFAHDYIDDSLFIVILGAVIGSLLGSFFRPLSMAILGALAGAIVLCFNWYIFGWLFLMIFNFGNWADNMSTLSGKQVYVSYAGGIIGAMFGFIMSAEEE